ncbi:MAG TPA: class I SAM-dependent methyltransferase [Geothrix sp.]|nr:class I SAM-dependent methyltransferase [Geothrix sp.]
MNDFDAKAVTWDQDPLKVERALTVGRAIAEAVPVANRQVLEYGCGTGLLGFVLQPQAAHVTLADTSEGMLGVLDQKILAAGARNMTSLRLDLLADPLPAARYDLICSLMTLHHIPDTDGLLRKFRELLAPGGWVALSDLDTEDGSFHGREVTDVHLGFDRGVLGRQLEAAGFSSITFTTPYEIQRDLEGGQGRFPIFLVVAKR